MLVKDGEKVNRDDVPIGQKAADLTMYTRQSKLNTQNLKQETIIHWLDPAHLNIRIERNATSLLNMIGRQLLSVSEISAKFQRTEVNQSWNLSSNHIIKSSQHQREESDESRRPERLMQHCVHVDQ